MSKKQQQPNLADLANTAGSKRKKHEAQAEVEPESREPASQLQANPRAHKGLRPITVHFPPKVRDQLKMLALEQSKPMQYVIAEAYNDLFAKYGKPEIAPTQSQ